VLEFVYLFVDRMVLEWVKLKYLSSNGARKD
jgi:hypothetical protein